MQIKYAFLALFTSMVLAAPSNLENESQMEKRCFNKWGDCNTHDDCCGDLKCTLHLTGDFKGLWCDN
ncbi:hypothetical protein BFW01_g5792 [Lasiodiplodia theobromae]|uniref:Uncharacterized protein n=2 Tax=Lasiodiplodia TaxID=66739 RepID=A0A5N5CY26_9PEZI|nr:O-superfamily protein [Lasiodiplodia theobromae]KAB2570184.1 hypothetical protein DBV05_g11147 [Lasiodiplodia theobromae]KAF4540602.1 O-superfamily protein [Lasiodiplodia theobromae]KAF9634897.1 hypothetical protein BFW01_g5792 [Lasiodiplodia theobromae]KAK0647848.1 hypothetical protein DIS24_g7349 [Lasiodiplodia hormozganensis]